jgi:uncharacterized protein YcbX
MQEFLEVGRLKEIWRYPVKSMAGERLERAHVYWYGLDGDRRAAFVRGDNRSGFPWLTAREVPELVRYRPAYTNLESLKTSPIEVETPDGRTLPLDSPELQAELAHAYGHDVSLIRIGRGVYDSMNVSVMSLATAQALNDAVDFPLNYRRFRQNLIIETFDGRPEAASGSPFAEESWIGSSIAIGDVHIRLNRQIERCVMVNVDPDTAVRDPRVLKLVAQTRNNYVGVGCTPETTGFIQVGDRVRLIA